MKHGVGKGEIQRADWKWTLESLKCQSRMFELYFIDVRSHWKFGGRKVTNLGVLWQNEMQWHGENRRVQRLVRRPQQGSGERGTG